MKSPTDSLAAIIAISVAAILVYELVGHIARCLYCGSIGGHKQNCPFDLNREER